MGLFKLTKDSSNSGIPSAIEFPQDVEFADSDTRITGDEDDYDMTGRGVNSRNVNRSSIEPQPMVDPMSIGFRGKEIGMVGKGVNTRRGNGVDHQQKQQQGAARNNNSNNPFADSNDAQFCTDSAIGNNHIGNKKPNPFDSDDELDHSEASALDNKDDNRGIDEIMQDYERKMKGLDETKFITFGVDSDEDDILSGIEEENSSNPNDVRKIPAKGMSVKNLFGKKEGTEKTNSIPLLSLDYGEHFDNTDVRSHISGEYDAEFDNKGMAELPLGVPNEHGGQYTHRQLEDELYLYKLETLNLTDACRELAEQLDEAERKLESVQAQATFRIHALEAELQDGHVGMKSLVKMTSTEMDGRLEALRALGKTASIQAEKIRERDMELNRMDVKLRKTLRDIKVCKRENNKIKDEKIYLKRRLGELEEVRENLQENIAKLKAEAHNSIRELSLEDVEKIEAMKSKLNSTLEQVGYLKSQVEYKDKEVNELRNKCVEIETESERIRDVLSLKENDVVRVELQLERVRKDLFDAAAAAKTAEETRIETQSREIDANEKLKEALAALEEATARVATLESKKDELVKLVEDKSSSEEDAALIQKLNERVDEFEKEVLLLVNERDDAVKAVESAQKSYEIAMAERQSEIDSLVKDVEVHAEQMLLAQSMLDEKESLVVDLRAQLNDVKSEYDISRSQLEEDLAAKEREVSNIQVELDEKIKDKSRLEGMLTKLRAESVEQKQITEADELDTVNEDDGAPLLVARASSTDLAEMEMKLERLERDLASSKRQIDAVNIELSEKDKASDRIRADLEKLRVDKNARVQELERVIEEKNKSLTNLRRNLDESKQSSNLMEKQLKSVESELAVAMEALKNVESANETSTNAIEESRAAEKAANHTCEKLKTQVELLQKAKGELHSELVALRIEYNNIQHSSTQAAATLAATNAARQAEMEMQIEKMQKDIDTKKREIDTIKTQLHEKDTIKTQLQEEVNNLRNEMVHYKEKIESEEEIKSQALQAIADKEYFEEDEQSLTSMNSSSRLGLFSRFSRSKTNLYANDCTVECDGNDTEKEIRIEQLEKTCTENALVIFNLKKELVSAASKFNKDESQRRMLIQRLENENQAYSIKLEMLENEFNELKKNREISNYNGNRSSNFESGIEQMKNKSFGQSFFTAASENSCDSGSTSSMSGVSAISGASRMHPLERDNKKLKKQKILYESRISSLQTQLSEIQQIIPELMSKSKAQISKLDNTIKTQKEEARVRERNLNDEILALKDANEQLQAATRSRLQASDIERQDEIEQLKMRLEAKEATIQKLEALSSGRKSQSFKKNGSKLLRKKKDKSEGKGCENSVRSGVGSSVSGSMNNFE